MELIKVRFLKDGEPRGRAYSYYTPETVKVDDIVAIDRREDKETLAIVVETGVSEAEVAEFKDRLKTIIGKSSMPNCEGCKYCEICDDITVCCKGNDGSYEGIGKSIPVQIKAGDGRAFAYGWCKGRYYKAKEQDENVI